MTQAVSGIYLPLRTSVEMFSDPAKPPALVRAKQAAILHDRLAVEIGYLDVTMAESGSSTWWTPPDKIAEEQTARARNPAPAGTPFSLAIGAQPGPGQPPTAMHTMIAGKVAAAYGAEWESEVLAPLRAIQVDWVDEVVTGGGDISLSHPVGKVISQQNFRDMGDRTLLPGVDSFKRSFIYQSFNRDAAVADELGMALHVTSLFEPMLEHRGQATTVPSGDVALEVICPNLHALSWENIAEFREHPGAEEARGLMREFEQRAAEQEPSDARDYLLKVSQQVTECLKGALRDKQTNIPKAVTEDALKTGISFIPVVGPFIEKGVSAAQLVATKRAERRSGVAALIKLGR